MAIKICLFTAHSPTTGGGAVIIRSLIPELKGFDITWRYLANNPSKDYEDGYLGKGIMGSMIVNDVYNTWRMLSGLKVSAINIIIDKLLETDCDAYWIVAHNEGIRVALELSRLQNKRPVHLTVHDDWSGALAARSKRYFFMTGIAKKITTKVLKDVNSVDLISKGMVTYYMRLHNRKYEVSHRYLSPDNLFSESTGLINPLGLLSVGHIGSIYDKDDFISFLDLLKHYGILKNMNIKVNMWGYHPKKNDIPSSFEDILCIHGDLPEEKVIPELQKTDFVYAMYPMAAKHEIFCRTSLPTKLSSYVMASRPVFAHCPKESTLAEFMNSSELGVVWTSNNIKKGLKSIDEILDMSLEKSDWEKARKMYFGENNIKVLAEAFTNPV